MKEDEKMEEIKKILDNEYDKNENDRYNNTRKIRYFKYNDEYTVSIPANIVKNFNIEPKDIIQFNTIGDKIILSKYKINIK